LRTCFHPDLILLLLLESLDLLTVHLILSQPVLDQALHIFHKALRPPVVYPEAHDENPAPENQTQSQVYPEDDGSVHHVQDLERDEEYGEQGEDGGDIGLCDEFVEERREVRGQGARDAEEGCEELEEGACKGGWEEARDKRCVVWQYMLA